MRRPVFWSRSALDDIKEQIAFIARDNPAVARQVAERFRDAGAALGETATARPGPAPSGSPLSDCLTSSRTLWSRLRAGTAS
ncbi:type II toxin-antitoxin system RelE/ParE family toxin [Methylobacterium brachiatum]